MDSERRRKDLELKTGNPEPKGGNLWGRRKDLGQRSGDRGYKEGTADENGRRGVKNGLVGGKEKDLG